MNTIKKLNLETISRCSNSVAIKEHVISIRSHEEFAILQRKPNENGLQGITFSFPVTAKDADLFDKSGIVEVISFSETGTMVFARKSFYENNLMIDLIYDLLKKHESQQQRIAQLA